MLRVNVPFAFVVNGEVLPAGEYRIGREASAIRIRREYGSTAGIFVLTRPVVGRNPGGEAVALIFTPNEGVLQLVRVWESGSTGREVLAQDQAEGDVAQMIVFAGRAS